MSEPIQYNVYCDESRHTSDSADRYLVLGALVCPRERKPTLVRQLHLMQARHAARGEFGWSKVAPGKAAFYDELIAWFAQQPDVRFRALIADRSKLNHEQHNEGDSELGFYKLYYQMLVHWLTPGANYHIYLDYQQNACQRRFGDLRDCLERKLTGRAKIACLEPVDSAEQPLIQLTDVLIGALGYAWNRRSTSNAKLAFCEHLAASLGKQNMEFCSYPSEDAKFNVFSFKGR